MVKPSQQSAKMMASIALENLINPLHREFVKETLIAANQYKVIAEVFSPQLRMLQQAYNNEVNAVQQDSKPQKLTQEIYQLSNERAKALVALKAALRATMGLTDARKVAAATRLRHRIRQYTREMTANVDDQSGTITTITYDIKENYLADLQLSDATIQFEQLERINQLVEDKVIERDHSRAGKGINRMRNARLNTDKAWRALRNAVNAYALVNGRADYKEFIGYMNALVLRYKRTHLHQHVEAPQ